MMGKRPEAKGSENMDGKPQVLMIFDKQKMPETRCSARIEQQ
jgi:hypothetical protein